MNDEKYKQNLNVTPGVVTNQRETKQKSDFYGSKSNTVWGKSYSTLPSKSFSSMLALPFEILKTHHTVDVAENGLRNPNPTNPSYNHTHS